MQPIASIETPTRVNPPPPQAINPGRPGMWRVVMAVGNPGLDATYALTWENPAQSSLDATALAIAWAHEGHQGPPPKVRVLEVLQVGT